MAATRFRNMICMLGIPVSFAIFPLQPQAQGYPNKLVRLIVPFEAGGGNDLVARLVSVHLAPTLGRPVIVENRPGAGGNIGTEYVAKQPADGYTLLVSSAGYIINASLYSKLPYDPIKDFAAVSLITKSPAVLTVNAASEARSLKELIALSRSAAKGLTYGSAGIGTPLHFAVEMIRGATNANFLHIPYKGSAGVAPAVLAGNIDFAMTGSTAVMPNIRSGKLRPLAVMSSTRFATLPDVPTVSEALGNPEIFLDGWVGALAPAGTPRDILGRLSEEIRRVVHDPSVVKEKLAPIDLEGVGSTPDQFEATIRSDARKYSAIAKAANIQPQ